MAITLLLIALMMAIPPIRADWVFVTNTYDGTFVIDPGSWYALYAYRTEGYKSEFALQVTASGNSEIDFFICDAGNYSLWSDGYTATVYKLHENIVSYGSHFVYPYSDDWYFVFSNTFSLFTSKTVQFTNDLYQWVTPTTPPTLPTIPSFYPLMMLSFGIIVVVIIGVAAIVIARDATRKPAIPTPPPLTQRHCTNCGTPLTGNETYCGECGAQLRQQND